MSYRYKSHSVSSPEYDASVTWKEYALALPTSLPLPALVVEASLLFCLRLTMLVDVLISILGVPNTLLTFTRLPRVNGTNAESILSLSLGFATSTIVVFAASTS